MSPKKHSVNDAIAKAQAFVDTRADLSSDVRSIIDLLLVTLELLSSFISSDSNNSSKPPSQDPYRAQGSKRKLPAERRKPGGQLNRKAVFLKKVSNPDVVKVIEIDRRTLPKGQ